MIFSDLELARRLELLEHEAAEIAAARLREGEAAEIRTRLAADAGREVPRASRSAAVTVKRTRICQRGRIVIPPRRLACVPARRRGSPLSVVEPAATGAPTETTGSPLR